MNLWAFVFFILTMYTTLAMQHLGRATAPLTARRIMMSAEFGWGHLSKAFADDLLK